MNLSESQVNELARSLSDIIVGFYKDPKHEEEFERWLRTADKKETK